jgi:hypothetical protein
MKQHTINCIYCKHSFDVKLPPEVEERQAVCKTTLFKAQCVNCKKLFVVKLPGEGVSKEAGPRPKFQPPHPPHHVHAPPHPERGPHPLPPRKTVSKTDMDHPPPPPEAEILEVPTECITEVIEPGTAVKPHARPSVRKHRHRRFAADQPVEVHKEEGYWTRPRYAAVILVIVFIFGLVNSITNISYITETASSDDLEADTAITTMTISGSVMDYTTTMPVANADVDIIGTGHSTRTNAEGFYVIDNAPTGEQTVSVSASGYKTVSKKVRLSPVPEKIIDFELEKGSGAVSIDDIGYDAYDESDQEDDSSWNILGMLMLVFAILAIVSAYLAYKKIMFWICGITAFFGALSFGFGFGLFLGLVALILILSSKDKFLKMQDDKILIDQ